MHEFAKNPDCILTKIDEGANGDCEANVVKVKKTSLTLERELRIWEHAQVASRKSLTEQGMSFHELALSIASHCQSMA